MSDLVLETIRAIIVSVIFIYLLIIGEKEEIRRQEGWLYILFGFGLIFFGMLIDITDNFSSLNHYIIIGDTKYQAFLEKVVGYLFGFILLAFGFWKWMPTIIRLRIAERELKKSHDKLELRIEERMVELREEITERKHAEEALRESEERFRETVELLPSIVCEFDTNGHFTYVNTYGLETFGYTHTDIEQGLFSADLFPPSEIERFKDRFGLLMKGETPDPTEYRLQTKDGSTIYVISDSAPIYKDGKIVGARAGVTPITERKQAEEALRQSEEKYKHLTEELSDVVLTITLDGNLSYVSPAIIEFGGYDPKEEIGNNIAKYFATNSELIAAINLVEKISIDKTSSSIEFLFKPKNIESFYVEVTGKPLIRKNEVVSIQCVMRDISKRKQTEDALRESEEKYRLLIDNLPNIVFKGYKDGSIDFIDDKIESLTGYKKEEFNSRKINWFDIVFEEDKEKMRQTFIEALKTNKSYIREYRIKTKASRVLWIQEGSQIVCDDSEKIEYISGAFTDVTESKRIEIQLQQIDRIESMGTLAGGIAHDFNNLLMGIQGRTSLMLLDSDSSHSYFEHLKGIEDYVKSAANLTKQLLGFARAGKYEVKSTDLNEVIKKQNQMFGRTRKEINILEKYEKKLWPTEVDQGQIEQVLLNIFVNAWQAMPGGGNLHIQTENVIIDENYNKPYRMRPGKYIKLSVIDTGFGMDEATRQKVFDPFFTTKGIGRGAGLGLASAYGIIKNHSGYIDVYSEKGKGTKFEIYLPASEKEVVKKEKLPEEMLGGSETILFVDDEYVVIDVGQQILESLGYTVFQVRSGKEALEVYRKNQNEIDMVILDMIMPEMSGGDTYDRFKEINPDIKVLLSSGYSIDGQATDILERGCNGFIQKPFKMTDFSNKIREILDKE